MDVGGVAKNPKFSAFLGVFCGKLVYIPNVMEWFSLKVVVGKVVAVQPYRCPR